MHYLSLLQDCGAGPTCNCLTSSGLKVREPSSLMVLLTASTLSGLLMPLTMRGGTLSGSSGSGPPSPEAENPSSEAEVPVSEPCRLVGRDAAAARSAACTLKGCCRGLVLPFCKACSTLPFCKACSSLLHLV